MSETDDGPRAGLPADASPGTPPKATLFCRDCGHAARYDGDWRRIESVRTTRYRCPECGVVVTRRPRERSGLDPLRYWRSAWETSLRVLDGVAERV